MVDGRIACINVMKKMDVEDIDVDSMYHPICTNKKFKINAMVFASLAIFPYYLVSG